MLKTTVWEPTIGKEITVSHSLYQLSNSGLTLSTITYVKKLNSLSAYVIHCDLIDTNKNLFNDKRSDLWAKFDVRGKPDKKVSYISPPDQVLRDCSTQDYVHNIMLTVKDADGEVFDFNGMPPEFELELN